MTGYELAQWQYDRQEPPERTDMPDEYEAEGDDEDLYDLAARLIACML